MKTSLVALSIVACLSLGGCAHHARVYSAPDHTALTAAKQRLYQAVTSAKAQQAKVTAGIEQAKAKHAGAVGTVAKIVPEVQKLEQDAPPELRPQVAQVGEDLQVLRSQNADTGNLLVTISQDQAQLSARLADAEAAKADVDKLGADYLARVEDLTGKLNTAEAAWAKDSKEIVKLRTESILFKILSVVGGLALGALVLLYFTGKIALKAAPVAAAVVTHIPP